MPYRAISMLVSACGLNRRYASGIEKSLAQQRLRVSGAKIVRSFPYMSSASTEWISPIKHLRRAIGIGVFFWAIER